jgi:hypothetical protein
MGRCGRVEFGSGGLWICVTAVVFTAVWIPVFITLNDVGSVPVALLFVVVGKHVNND